MLDKSVPFVSFLMKMRREKLASLPSAKLPEGYSFRLYQDGDEVHWARLETQVLEFASQQEALDYFNHDFRDPFREELYRRCVFVCDKAGIPVATATAWFMECSLGHQCWLQWVSTDPAHQGKGLGKAVITKALHLYAEVGPDTDLYLSTQTWSHKAMCLYHKLGFELSLVGDVEIASSKAPGFQVMANRPMEALDRLEGILSPELIAEFRANAEPATEDEQIKHPLNPPFPAWYNA